MTAPLQTNKPKSPATPSYSLKVLRDDVQKVYDKFSHASFSQAEVASALNMSSGSGAFVTRIFSMTAFGLLDKKGDKYIVSKLFHSLDPANSEATDFKKAALGAICRAPVFADLLADFKNKLPAESIVAQRLEKEKGFNADRAKQVAAVLQRSLEFAALVDTNNNILPIRDDDYNNVPRKKEGIEPISLDHDEDAKSKQSPGPRRTEVPLAEGRVAVIQYPHDLNSEDAAKISRVIDAIAT